MSTTRTRYLPSASRCFARWPPINPPPPQTTARSFAIGPHAPDKSIDKSPGLSILRPTLSSLRQSPAQHCTLLQHPQPPAPRAQRERARTAPGPLPIPRFRRRKSRERPLLSQPVRDVLGGTIAEQARQLAQHRGSVGHKPRRQRIDARRHFVEARPVMRERRPRDVAVHVQQRVASRLV